MRRLKETTGVRSRGLLNIRWSLVLLGSGLLIGLAAVLDPVLEPYLGDFNAQAALIAGALFVVVGYVVTTILKLVGR